jgi:hypothetical protein
MEKVIFEGRYIIYSDGRIWSVKRSKFLKPHLHHTGYYRVIIDKKDQRINRLVAESFIPNPNNLPYVNHINEDKTDNRVENLEWCTNRYNIAYSKKSKYKGVYFHNGKYDVRIYHNGKNLYLGRYDSPEEGSKVYTDYIRLHNL